MRYCSNPDCRQPIDQAFGFVKTGDWLACREGKILPEQVRELCGRCGALVDVLIDQDKEVPFYRTIGWLLDIPQLLLPPPRVMEGASC